MSDMAVTRSVPPPAAAEGWRAAVVAAAETLDAMPLDLSARLAGARLAAVAAALLLPPASVAAGPSDEVDPARLVRQVARPWAPEAEALGARLVLAFDSAAPDRIETDGLVLARLVGFLLGVAVAARPPAGSAVVLRATAAGDAPVFEFDLPAGPLADGDVALAARIAGTLGGSVARTEGPEGAGALRLRLRLPAPRAVASAAPSLAPLPPGGPFLPDLRGLRILLAEDNATNQLVAGQMLEAMGAVVVIASDGAEALDWVAREPFDLLLVDIEMPRVSGLDVIRRIRAGGGAAARMPIIALTAYALRDHRDRIAASGADGLIAKPIQGITAFGEEIRARVGRAPDPGQVGATAAGPGTGTAVPRVPGPAAAGLIDPATWRALAATIGPAAMGELLAKVEEDLRAVGEGLDDGLARGDFALVRGRTHILISVAGAVGAGGVQALAEQLNRAAHGSDPARLETLGRETRARLSALIAAIAAERQGD